MRQNDVVSYLSREHDQQLATVLGGLDFPGVSYIGRARCRADATDQGLARRCPPRSVRPDSPSLLAEVKSAYPMHSRRQDLNHSHGQKGLEGEHGAFLPFEITYFSYFWSGFGGPYIQPMRIRT